MRCTYSTAEQQYEAPEKISTLDPERELIPYALINITHPPGRIADPVSSKYAGAHTTSGGFGNNASRKL